MEETLDYSEVEGEELDGNGIQSRMMHGNQGFGWTPQSTMPLPGGVVEGQTYGYSPISGSGSALYPNIGFDPSILQPHPPALTMTTKYMECPTRHCRKVLSAPIYQCRNGHTICNSCVDRLDYCTECMASLEGPKIRNIALEQELGHSLTVIKCPNERDRCPMVLYSGEELNGHLEVCRFRGFPFCSQYLGYTNCYDRVTRSSLLRHLSEKHQVEGSIDNHKFILKLVAPSRLLQPSSHSVQGIVWNPLIINLNDEGDHRIILKTFVSAGGALTLSGYLFSSSLSSYDDAGWKKYRVKFQIDSGLKAARLEWTGRLIYHNWNETTSVSNQPVTNVNTFRIPLSALQEYIQPANDDDVDEASSKIKIRVFIWKFSDDHMSPFLCPEELEEETLDKRILFGKIPGQDINSFSFPTEDDDYSRVTSSLEDPVEYGEEFANYYSRDSNCSHCHRPLYGDVIYQCLQCPSDNQATYFCRPCIERGNNHGDHLTVRISKPALQPLAAVAFECSAGELH